MYEIRPESISTFIEDSSIKLPRFQRKQTWDDKRNFELCISIFKEFPMGVCILNVESEANGRTTKWLLDGRQRRNALTKIWEDPENIYQWAKKWIGFKANDQLADVAEKFREKIQDYLEDDQDEVEKASEVAEQASDPASAEELSIPDASDGADSAIDITIDLSKRGVEFLLEIIQLIHNKTVKYSGFTRPFDFTKYISNLPYQEFTNGKASLSCKKLKSFIDEYQRWCRDNSEDQELVNSFKLFLKERFPLDIDRQAKIDKQVAESWVEISARIEILRKLHEVLHQSKIGLIELKNIRSTDSQKIFNIINSKGTKLNAVEILSAKPSWNKIIANPSGIQVQAKNDLYNRIGIRYDGVVRWDLPATLLPRLKDIKTFLDTSGDTKTALEKQLTFGFKILSGIMESGIRKENVDNLSRNANINWELDFEALIEDLNLFMKVMLEADYFRFFKSWRKAIMNITSDAVALNFMLVMFADWKRKGRPVSSGTELRQFQKNSFILLDQLIFEYVTRQWRGSSDSKVATNLSLVPSSPSLFPSISTDKWRTLITDIFDSNLVGSEKVTQRAMEPLLYHFYSIKKIAAPDADSIEVDHIIPQSLFKSSAYSNDESLPHNLFNLALLPKRDNVSKSDKILTLVPDAWLKQQIVRYAFVDESDFGKYSNISNLIDLRESRRPIFEAAFGQLRTDILNN
jgi:Protein of unknown function DUF262/HNH endonuclease